MLSNALKHPDSSQDPVWGVWGVGSIIGKLRCAAIWLEADKEETQQK